MDWPLKIKPDWFGASVIVAASGPSLTPEVAREVRFARWLDGWKVLCVNDAYRVLPWADAMYASDLHWWQVHKGAPEFHGVRYTSSSQSLEFCDDKREAAKELPGLMLIGAKPGIDFSKDSEFIHYGDPPHSGFQAINLALLMGAEHVVLVGFDYQYVHGKSHFFGDHPENVRQYGESAYLDFAGAFKTAPSDKILNATPNSFLTAYPQVTLDEAFRRHDSLYWNRAEPHA